MIITTNTTDMPDANKVMVARVCVQHHSFVAIKILKDVNVFHGFSLPLPVDRPLFFVPIIYPQFNRVIHQDKKIVLSCCSQNKNTSGPHALAVVPVRQGNCRPVKPLAPLDWRPRGPVRTGGLLEWSLMLIFLLAYLKATSVFGFSAFVVNTINC